MSNMLEESLLKIIHTWIYRFGHRDLAWDPRPLLCGETSLGPITTSPPTNFCSCSEGTNELYEG